MYESGVGEGSGEAVTVGNANVGVVVGGIVWVGVLVSTVSAMLPVRLSARYVMAPPIPIKSRSKMMTKGALMVITGIRLPWMDALCSFEGRLFFAS